jgi:CheY-like chemotaxis protein
VKGTPRTVLLAGDAVIRCSTLRKWIAQRGCHCQFVVSFGDACTALSEGNVDLVIAQYDLPDRTAFPLLDWLEESPSTLVFANSSPSRRWLPVVIHGRRSLDSPLLRTAGLPAALGKILGGAVARNDKEKPAVGFDFVPVGAK